MNFLRLNLTQAKELADDPNEEYSPVYDSLSIAHYIYSPPYTSTELIDVHTLSSTQLDGLTPINPTKPMFPRK